MLEHIQPTARCKAWHKSESGFALIAALIALVVMTLAAIALVRSVDTTNLIAGNMAFQQSTANSSDLALNTAVTWLVAHRAGVTLQNNSIADGYFASDPCPANPTTCANWVSYLNTIQAAGQMKWLPADSVGNTAGYVIHRLCSGNGASTDPAAGCSLSTSQGGTAGQSQSSGGAVPLQGTSQAYYRISIRVNGPRNTVSYVQSIVML